jgi:hypothetical protein
LSPLYYNSHVQKLYQKHLYLSWHPLRNSYRS